MDTYKLKIVEKVPLLENELKGSLTPLHPSRAAKELGDWTLGKRLGECRGMCVSRFVSVCMCVYVKAYVDL